MPFKKRLSDVRDQLRRSRVRDAEPSSKQQSPPGPGSTAPTANAQSSSRHWGRSDSNPRKKAAFFRSYCDEGGRAITTNGIERLCADMEVEMDDVRMLSLAWHLGVDAKWEVLSKAFIDTCSDLNVDCAVSLRRELDGLLYESRRHFKEFYRFVFNFELVPGQKSLSKDTAIRLWSSVLPICSGDGDRFMNEWFEYLNTADIRGVTKDLWDGFLEFSQAVDEDFGNFSEDDAWPSVVDEFVVHQQAYRMQQLAGSVPVYV